MNKLTYYIKSFYELSPDELYAIMRMRQEIFIVEQTCYYLDADDRDQESYHVLGQDDQGHWQAYARIVPLGLSYTKYGSIGRILTSQSYRGTGAGKQLLNYSIKCYKEKYGQTPLKISAQSHLLSFYNQFGFVSTGEEYLEDGIPHTGMVLGDKH